MRKSLDPLLNNSNPAFNYQALSLDDSQSSSRTNLLQVSLKKTDDPFDYLDLPREMADEEEETQSRLRSLPQHPIRTQLFQRAIQSVDRSMWSARCSSRWNVSIACGLFLLGGLPLIYPFGWQPYIFSRKYMKEIENSCPDFPFAEHCYDKVAHGCYLFLVKEWCSRNNKLTDQLVWAITLTVGAVALAVLMCALIPCCFRWCTDPREFNPINQEAIQAIDQLESQHRIDLSVANIQNANPQEVKSRLMDKYQEITLNRFAAGIFLNFAQSVRSDLVPLAPTVAAYLDA